MRFRGVVYRAHNPEWAWKPLSGEGARRHGGRFNRRGVPALYTSLSPLTAIREAQPLGRRMQPLTLCAYDVDLEPVFDSRDGAVRAALQVDDHELDCRSWAAQMLDGSVPASQALADRLVSDGYVGMLVRSFAVAAGPGDINLVVWKWGSQRPCRVDLIDDESRLSTSSR
ncbi:MAG: RES domain-containing protein [Acidobacteriota bacterium]|nr:RES domain-containing protein [Acidobacteriota bacterium]